MINKRNIILLQPAKINNVDTSLNMQLKSYLERILTYNMKINYLINHYFKIMMTEHLCISCKIIFDMFKMDYRLYGKKGSYQIV